VKRDSDHLLVTVSDEETLYEEGHEAIKRLAAGKPVEKPATVTFTDEEQLSDVFDGPTYTLLRVVRDCEPTSIDETAELLGRDVEAVRAKLTTLEALGAVRLEGDDQSKRPVFPYDDLLIRPFAGDEGDSTAIAP
jgi:predicted transcriptional regulator